MDLIAIPFLPLDIAIELREAEPMAPIQRALREWADAGADANGLPTLLGSRRISTTRLAVGPGGSAANALRVAAAWGCQVALGGVLGQDPAGDLIHSADARSGIDLSLVQRPARGLTPINLMLLRGGQMTNTALIPRARRVRSLFRGARDLWLATAERLRALAPRGIHLHTANQSLARLIEELPDDTHVSLNLAELPDRAETLNAVERIVRRAHLVVLSDVGLDGWLTHLAPSSSLGDPVSRCAALLDALFELAPKLALGVVTRGARGLVARGGDGAPLSVPAYGQPGSPHPIKLVDPTGAGDVFTGTSLALLSERDWRAPDGSEPLRALLVRSSVAAALNCERLGAVTQIPTRTEVEARLQADPRPLAHS
jgi:sugar/nucleoside kinase (ribokinase family)